jgi:hypothetical protein
MSENIGFDYPIDFVFCIDATGSMGPLIEKVKNHALKFHEDLEKKMAERNKRVSSLRIKLVVFRDFYADGTDAVLETPFFEIPESVGEFHKSVKTISARGGGDAPESGLEGLALAIKSPWKTTGVKKRHVIVVWTDTSAHPLEMNAGSKPPNYPPNLPKDLDELTDLWSGQDSPMSIHGQRLILFAPEVEPWTTLGEHWERTYHFTAKAGEGLNDFDYEEILDAIAGSV